MSQDPFDESTSTTEYVYLWLSGAKMTLVAYDDLLVAADS